MSSDTVNIEVDGKPVKARKGQMIIEVTDEIGAYVPRFCYHEKLSIAANCRMCLVEVEKAPKPLPACATPVGEGMKVFTRSRYAQEAQKATMEFLLINHPLDCPICDQGGECELQDLAMGFGRGVSRYTERKRVVKDKDIGPLVSTDMTRCIHCTRCIRFGEEIQGYQELGTTDRGEHMKIGTYIEKAIDHELSANIIDLCPVGALNNKPYRYSARSWEMMQRATISPHDCVGSNLSAHVLRGTIKRVVPRYNEAINETWIADRDRFSYEGIYSEDRLKTPRWKSEDKWEPVDWESALESVAEALRNADPAKVGFLVSPGTTVEEGYLVNRLAAHIGTSNLDHRLRQQDFADQDNDPVAPTLGCSIADLESSDAVLVVGSNLRSEAPILAHRVRKASLDGASIAFVNDDVYRYFFDIDGYFSAAGLVDELAALAVAACDELPEGIREICKGHEPSDDHRRVAQTLRERDAARVLLGNIALRHPGASALRALAGAIAASTGATLGYVTEGANTVGLHLAGVLPHRDAAGAVRDPVGLTVADLVSTDLDVLVVVGAEPGWDMPAIDPERYGFVVGLSPFRSPALELSADVMLPMGSFAETSGTFVNAEGRWQSFGGVANTVAEARPGWKILRVLGNLLDVPDFGFESSEAIRDRLREVAGETAIDTRYEGPGRLCVPDGRVQVDAAIDVPIYDVDAVVRRATALQLTPAAQRTRGAAA